jgi:hypothetical protein
MSSDRRGRSDVIHRRRRADAAAREPEDERAASCDDRRSLGAGGA